MALAANEERGRAFGAAVVGAGGVPPHSFSMPSFCQRPREFFNIEADARRIANKVFELELLMILEEPVVHLPELPLGGSRLGCFRGQLGMWMHIREREMPKNIAQLVAKALPKLDDRVRRSATVWALEVAVLDEGQWGTRRAEDVVAAWVDRHSVRRSRAGGSVGQGGAPYLSGMTSAQSADRTGDG